jgi:glycosyltransferase involved in cell wall biosynthesis
MLVERDVESVKEALRERMFKKSFAEMSGIRVAILMNYTWKKIADQYRKLYV